MDLFKSLNWIHVLDSCLCYFRFGQEVKVKLGSPFCKYFLTIDDLYNGAKIMNLPLAVVEI